VAQASPRRRSGLIDAIEALGRWSAELCWAHLDDATRDRFAMLVHDTLAVTMAGAWLPEHRALIGAWPASRGPATAFGGGLGPTDRAAWLNGTASVALEMDCASRVTRGHAAAQSFFGVLAAGEERSAAAAEVLSGLVVGHEVASRFGRASTLAPGLHPHGSWGTAGAAAGSARALGLPGPVIARAIDAAGGLALSPAFSVATQGHLVRNHWVGFTNSAGLVAARMASAAPNAPITAVALDTYDQMLGELDVGLLAEDLSFPGESSGAAFSTLALHTDFVKRHAACGYSHAALDAIVLVRADPRWPTDPLGIQRIVVETTEPSASLAGVRVESRLAALFSLDYLVAAAAVHGETGPSASDEATRSDPTVLAVSDRVEVRVAPDIQARMPLDRGARVTVYLGDGACLRSEVPNAIWDPRHHPATWGDVRAKARRLLAPTGIDETALHDWVRLATTTDGPLPSLTPVVG
jgi:2-methylcitrate dehydratase PrpD